MKTDQITIRISSELKEQLYEIAEQRDIKPSEFIRQTLESAVDPNQIDTETRLDLLEGQIHGYEWTNIQIKAIKAAATVISIDKNMPIDQSLANVSKVTREAYSGDPSIADQLSRSNREKTSLQMIHQLQSDLDLSSIAVLALNLIVCTGLGIHYDEDIFQVTDFSMLTMQYIRDSQQ